MPSRGQYGAAMKASLLQQAGQSPLSVTRSRQAGQSRGSATSRPSRSVARRPCARRARREGCTVAARVHARLRLARPQSGPCSTWRQSPTRLRPRAAARAQARARALGPETFLIDRVAADLAERLGAVLRAVRRRGRSRHADRCACAARSQAHASIGKPVSSPRLRRTPMSSPTRRRCRFATARSIWWCRRSRCNSSTICPARSFRSAARSNPTGCSSPRCSAAIR